MWRRIPAPGRLCNVFMIAFFILGVSCAPAASSPTTAPANPASQAAAPSAPAGPAPNTGASGLKVAYLPCGRINDRSWSQVGYEGVVAAQKELGFELAYSESIPPADIEAAARDYASKGFNLILLHCGTFADAAYKVAQDFPNAWFQATSAPDTTANVYSYDPQQQEGTFFAGVLAGLTTKTNKIGAVVAYDFAGFNKQHEGLRLGARFVNPNVSMVVSYINSLEDAAKAKEAALAEFDAGADIILASTDQAISGIIEAARERNGLVIAQYADQSELAPNVILASVEYKQDQALSNIIRRVANNTMKGERIWPGLKDGVGTLAINPDLESRIPAEAKDCLNTLLQSYNDGKLTIPGTEALGKNGAAESIDPKSVIEGGTSPCLNKRT